MPDHLRRVSRRFQAEPASVPAARRFVVGELDRLPAETIEAALLMVSELATNALMYAGTDFTVEVERSASMLTISVTDSGGGSPEIRTLAAPTDLHGRGLFIVRELADAWGVAPAGGDTGKIVWFRIDLREHQSSSA